MTTRFHHINLCSKDPTDLENFYKNVLELAETSYDQITDKGYGGRVGFLTDGTSEMHLSTLDLNVAFRNGQAINPLERGHIAFRTDDIEGIKRRLTERGVPFADYGTWAIPGWQQIFFHDPEGTIVEVHQVGEPAGKSEA
ncbi:MAG: VOC family protein [Rhodopila sp.]|jgi:catechol 2,3-dioxygenase-like lactoylglutathione lyase family enzyme